MTGLSGGSIMILIMVVVGMFLLVGGMGFIVFKKIQASDPTKADTSIDPTISTAQDFLQFQDIRNGVMELGAHRYRAVIECSSINYHLKTPTEKEMIEVGYEQFINSLKFPITMFIQTRVIDSTYISQTLERDMETVRKKFPNLEAYMDLYLDSMKNLKHYLPNTKHKKKYVIVQYEDSYLMPELTDAEKYEYSLSELKNRVEMIKRGLEGVGINCKVMDTRDIIEMVYTAYHKEHCSPDKIDALADGDFFSLLTSGENRYTTLSSPMKVDLILNEAQNKIRKDILLSDDTPDPIKHIYKSIYEQLGTLRDEVGGHYKEGKSNNAFYENSIEKFKTESIKKTTGLTEIQEEDIKIENRYKNRKHKLTKDNQELTNSNNVLPTYGEDVYEERGFLDKDDKKRIAEEDYQYDDDNLNYEEGYEKSILHKSQYGVVSDEDAENYQYNVYNEKQFSNKTNQNLKNNNISKSKLIPKKEISQGNKETIKNRTTLSQQQINQTKNKSQDNKVEKDNQNFKTDRNKDSKQKTSKVNEKRQGYYDENISKNTIPNFEINLKNTQKKNNKDDFMNPFDDWNEKLGFENEDENQPNARTRDLSFFEDDKNKK